MLMWLAVGIAFMALTAAGGAYLRQEQHEGQYHRRRGSAVINEGNPIGNEELKGCYHSDEGCGCWNAGYAKGNADGRARP